MRRLVNWLTIILSGILFVAVIITMVLPAVFSARLAVVYSASMAPEMPMGALAWMESVDPAEIKVGDIIAFNPPRHEPDVIVSHRVVEVLSDGASLEFRTKGDANENPDFDVIPASNVMAKVTYNIPKAGYALARIRQYTRGQLGFVLFIGLPTIWLIGNATRDMNLALNPRKKRLAKLKERRERRRHGMFR